MLHSSQLFLAWVLLCYVFYVGVLLLCLTEQWHTFGMRKQYVEEEQYGSLIQKRAFTHGAQ